MGKGANSKGWSSNIQIPDSSILRPTNLTIDAWVRFDALDSAGSASPGQQYIVFKQNSRSEGFEGYNLGKTRLGGSDVLSFIVSSAGGQVVGKADWWGKRRFAYEIDHKSEGYYAVLNVVAPGGTTPHGSVASCGMSITVLGKVGVTVETARTRTGSVSACRRA